MNERGAIAIFVKTIGRSAVKTRLAAMLGREKAEEFYRMCVIATQAIVRQSCRVSSLDASWAVAEKESLEDPAWCSFPGIWQGEGDLGDRLDRVYEFLLGSHAFVILVGADAPLLSVEVIESAATAMGDPTGPDFAISRSFDGGYALFAGRAPIDRYVWRSVPYSTARTADDFVSRLRHFGGVAELPRVHDVDTFDDLERLIDDAERTTLLPEQRAVVQYARHLLEVASGVG